jgi:hypothetical protein
VIIGLVNWATANPVGALATKALVATPRRFAGNTRPMIFALIVNMSPSIVPARIRVPRSSVYDGTTQTAIEAVEKTTTAPSMSPRLSYRSMRTPLGSCATTEPKIAALLAETIRRVSNEESVSTLYVD